MSCEKFYPGDLLRVLSQPEESAWGWYGTLADCDGNLKNNAKVVRQSVDSGRIVYAMEANQSQDDEPHGQYIRVMLDGHTLTVPSRFLSYIA